MDNLTRRAFLARVFLTSATLSLGSCRRTTRESSEVVGDSRVPALVAVDPIAYLAERVGGERAEVFALTPRGKDPETYAPTPGSLQAVVKTRLLFRVGLPIEERFARNIASIAPDATSVDLTSSLDMLRDEHEHDHDREHEHEREHDREHDGDREPDLDREPEREPEPERNRYDDEPLDAHVWTSPANARVMVATMADAFANVDPEGEREYRASAEAFDAELAALQDELRERLAPYEGRSFVVFHPAYGYYAREFRLNQVAIEFEGKAPRPKQLQQLIERARADGIKKLIVQPEFNRSSADAIAKAIGGEVTTHSPLQKDYFANLRALTDAVVGSFSPLE